MLKICTVVLEVLREERLTRERFPRFQMHKPVAEEPILVRTRIFAVTLSGILLLGISFSGSLRTVSKSVLQAADTPGPTPRPNPAPGTPPLPDGACPPGVPCIQQDGGL